jgi:hypothetical protein
LAVHSILLNICDTQIWLSDEGDNIYSYFIHAYLKYSRELAVMPNVVIVKIGRYCSDLIESQLRQKQLPVDTFTFAGVLFLAQLIAVVIPSLSTGMVDGNYGNGFTDSSGLV